MINNLLDKNIYIANIYNFLYQFLKFGIVGILNTLITLICIFILMKIFKVSYIISNIIGYAWGLINSFILNKIWTFKSKGDTKKESILFILVYLITYILQLGLLILLKEVIHINADIAQIIGMIFYTITGFILNKFITFNKV